MTAGNRYGRGRDKSPRKSIFKGLIIAVLIFLSAVIQTTDIIKIFGSTPAITFALVCAAGFICGERVGAVIGIFAGVVTDALGASGVTLTILLYTICGYMCGAMVDWFLSTNFPSFLVYAALAGLIREGVTLIYLTLMSQKIPLGEAVLGLMLPEFFAYLVCAIPAYFAVFGIDKIFKVKDKRGYRV